MQGKIVCILAFLTVIALGYMAMPEINVNAKGNECIKTWSAKHQQCFDAEGNVVRK